MHSVDENEIQNFSKDSANWWDENGPFKPLHKLNPTRIGYLKSQICDHFDRDNLSIKALKDIDIIDIGCGGGLVCESINRLGANVTGVDADENAIHVAKQHAEDHDLDITYIHGAAENIEKKFDVVLALEVIEHVTDINSFIDTCVSLCKPDGIIIFSTLNRTAKSFALGIVAAEYILRWVPQGTHNWKKFVKPSQIARTLRANAFKTKDIRGLIYNPITDTFSMHDSDIDVNYFLSAIKA